MSIGVKTGTNPLPPGRRTGYVYPIDPQGPTPKPYAVGNGQRKEKRMNTYKKAVAFLRDAGRKAAAAPYWGMALLATADNATPKTVDIDPKKNQTRFMWTNPAAPKRGPVLSLPALFPQIKAGTIDGAIKQGIHFAHAARVAGVAGAAKAETDVAWQTICERYDVGFEDIRTVSGPLADWYRSDTTDKTPTAFAAVIVKALTTDPETETDPETDTDTDPETETETETNPLLAMVYGDGFPKRGDKLNALIDDAFDRDDGGAFYRLVRRSVERHTARVEADAADAASVMGDADTLAATGTDN